MMDSKTVQEAMATGLAFICATCKHWYGGVENGIKDGDGDTACMEHNRCLSPLSGGSFEFYDGPMKGNLMRFCYMCGAAADRAIESKGKEFRIGICAGCLEILKSRTKREPGRNVVFRSARLAGEDKFKEI